MGNGPFSPEMARAAKAHEIGKSIGLQVPINTELLKRLYVMNTWALAQFWLPTSACLTAVSVSFTGSSAGLTPRWAVIAGRATLPVGVIGPSHIPCLEPFHAARVGAEPIPFRHRGTLSFKVFPARLARPHYPRPPMRQRLALLRCAITSQAGCLARRGACLLAVRRLLRGYRELFLAGYANFVRCAFTRACHMSIIQDSHYPDHAPENCDPANLHLNCQRCHLAVDAAHRKALREVSL